MKSNVNDMLHEAAVHASSADPLFRFNYIHVIDSYEISVCRQNCKHTPSPKLEELLSCEVCHASVTELNGARPCLFKGAQPFVTSK